MPALADSDPRLVPVRPPRMEPGAGIMILRLAYLLCLLFGFLVAIETMSKAIQALADTGLLGSGEDGELFSGVSNPFAGLALGVLFTVLVQSSSTTTSTIVAVVGSGALSVKHAVPMILGANVGTTITNTLVSIGHVRRSREFRRAFAAATVHDFFNLMAVAVMLPIELATGFLSRTAGWLTSSLGSAGGAEYKSPFKKAIRGVHGRLVDLVEASGLDGKMLSVALLVVGIGLTFLCLYQITRNMRSLMAGRIERAMNRTLESSGLLAVVIGIMITVAVQSSSITTSLLVPMCAAGVMRLRNAFPIMLGANIGTTVTALLASLAQDRPEALTIALVHLLFNVIGVATCLVFPPIQAVPIRLAEALAKRAAHSPIWIVSYVLGVFVVIPFTGWLVWR
ncbi:MAG: Na/Pi symporter [Planctomycetota bacterium]|nr:Na/Pi symporter [Planctomycetota bacterium]